MARRWWVYPGQSTAACRRGEPEQGVDHGERGGVELEHPILEIEPKVERHLVVARAAGVESLAQARMATGEPGLHRGMDVLVCGIETQPAGWPPPRGPAQPAPERA